MIINSYRPFFSVCRFLIVVFCCFITMFKAQSVWAQSRQTYYDIHSQGWHWYNTQEEKNEKDKKGESSKKIKDPIKQMDALKATIQKVLNTAILQPTDENVKNYIALQNRVSDQSSRFAQVWQKVLFENPELNYSLIHPTNSLAKQVDLDIQRKKEDQAIAKLAQESGLFFFYSSLCSYCQKFAPIVKRFATTYDVSIIPITLDGIALPEFPESRIDRGQAAKFNVKVEPSLFAVNPYTQKAYPVAHGFISETGLRKRILDIAQDFKGDI